MNQLSISPTLLLVIYSALALIAALSGGSLPSVIRLTHTRLQVAVSFVAGLMLGLALLHMLPHAAEELASVPIAASWLLAGFLVMFLVQRFLPFHHHDVADDHHHSSCDHEHDEPVPATGHLGWVGVALGLSFHSIFDGLALATAVISVSHGHGGALGAGTALAVILHKPFSAMAITTLMAASGAPRKWWHWVNTGFACVTPLAAVGFFLGATGLSEAHVRLTGPVLAFCAGTFLCIACTDLLPELQFHAHDPIKLSLALLAGVGAAVLIGTVGHGEHEHAQQLVPSFPTALRLAGCVFMLHS